MLKQLVFALMLLLPLTSLSQQQAERRPRGSEATGTVSSLNPARLAVTVGDKGFIFTTSTRVLNSQGKPGYYSSLAVGQPVHYYYTLDDARRYVITQIEILPPGTDVYR